MVRNKSLILVVDDNQQNIQVLGAVLEQAGYGIAVAVNGQQALDYLVEEKPDLVLLDVMMPAMDGYEVCRTMKKDRDLKNIPVIFLTARGETGDLVRGFEAGGVDYITKPFHPEELLARVKTHVELKKAREEIRSLRGIIPICASCKKIRTDSGYWEQVDTYIENHSEAEFTHGVCPVCAERLYGIKFKEKNT